MSAPFNFKLNYKQNRTVIMTTIRSNSLFAKVATDEAEAFLDANAILSVIYLRLADAKPASTTCDEAYGLLPKSMRNSVTSVSFGVQMSNAARVLRDFASAKKDGRLASHKDAEAFVTKHKSLLKAIHELNPEIKAKAEKALAAKNAKPKTVTVSTDGEKDVTVNSTVDKFAHTCESVSKWSIEEKKALALWLDAEISKSTNKALVKA
jgi:hypothetical protein